MTGTDPDVLLTWMRKRDGVITGRDISDSGPRPFRRRAAADMALAALIEAGEIVEVSARPRAFELKPAQLAPVYKLDAAEPGQNAQVSCQNGPKSGATNNVRDLLDVAIAQHRHASRSAAASLILGAADVRDMMRRDPHHAPEPNANGRCQHCGGIVEGQYAELLHGVRVHIGCVLKYRNSVDRHLDVLIADALENVV